MGKANDESASSNSDIIQNLVNQQISTREQNMTNITEMSLNTDNNASHILGPEFQFRDRRESSGDKNILYEATSTSQMANRLERIPSHILLSPSAERLNTEARRRSSEGRPAGILRRRSSAVKDVTNLSIMEQAEVMVDFIIMEALDVIKLYHPSADNNRPPTI
ncbi:hypothetical protein O3M35_009165 [Rhynocoris fuscipes]|uniref:Uncharacterized protein n=1 Tax=Rhynocoris fuscipes TaxID=488301 RepID=A0AAW1D462_9HEMI